MECINSRGRTVKTISFQCVLNVSSKMPWLLIRNTVIFTCAVILLFDTVRISAPHTKPIEHNELMTVKLTLTNIIDWLPAENAKVLGCNALYRALFHVKLSHKLAADELVKYSYHKWSKKLLVYILLSKHTRSMRVPMWAFCLYTYTMSSGESIDSAYEETFEILRDKLENECPVLNHPVKSYLSLTYKDYMAIVLSLENNPTTLVKNVEDVDIFLLEENTPVIKTLADTFADNISIHLLLLSHVLESSIFLDTLIDKFGLIPNDGFFKEHLARDYTMISDPKRTLQDRFGALHDVYYHVKTVFKIMMIRLCVYHLTIIKEEACVDYRSWCNSKIADKLRRFTRLFWFRHDDSLMPLIEQFECEKNGDTETIEKLQTGLTNELKDICDLWKLDKSYSETISIKLPTVKKPEGGKEIIEQIANSVGMDMKSKLKNCENVLVRDGIKWTNLYADDFVDCLEKTITVSGYFLYDYVYFKD